MSKLGKKDIVEKLVATDHYESKKAADAALTDVLNVIQEAVIAGDEVAFVGFGTFGSKKRGASEGRNPSNGNKINIPAKTVPFFKAGKSFKDAVNK